MRKASVIIVSIILLSAICFNTTGCKGESSEPESADSTSVTDSIGQEEAIADTIEDASALNGIVMAGSYIRPFTVDLTYTLKF